MENQTPKARKRNVFTRHRILTFLVIILAATLVWAVDGKYYSTEKPADTGGKAATNPPPAITVKMTIAGSNATAQPDGTTLVTGTIRNNEQDKHSAIVQATFYDKRGAVLGTAKGDAGAIQPGQTLPFHFSAPVPVLHYYRMVVEVNSIS